MCNRRKRAFTCLSGTFLKKCSLYCRHCLSHLSILSTCHTEFTIDVLRQFFIHCGERFYLSTRQIFIKHLYYGSAGPGAQGVSPLSELKVLWNVWRRNHAITVWQETCYDGRGKGIPWG